MKIQNIVVWAWISWCTIAERLASKWEQVLIIDKRNHIWWNCYDYYDENGILVHKYGPHIFRTNFDDVYEYVNRFTTIIDYQHCNYSFVDWKFVNFPFNFNTLYSLFSLEEAKKIETTLLKYFSYWDQFSILDIKNKIQWINWDDKDILEFLVNYIIDKTNKNYVMKQWGLSIDEVDKSIFDRIPIKLSRDNRAYSNRKHQWMPNEWYTKMFENMINNKNISVLLNTEAKKIMNAIEYERLFWTWPIDEYFDYRYWELDYKKTLFKFEYYDVNSYQDYPVISYPNDYDYTRMTEMKKLYPNSVAHKIEKTVICKEYPLIWTELAYPVEIESNLKILEKYHDDAKKLNNVYFIWRLANYKYQDMDLTFKRALDLINNLY